MAIKDKGEKMEEQFGGQATPNKARDLERPQSGKDQEKAISWAVGTRNKVDLSNKIKTNAQKDITGRNPEPENTAGELTINAHVPGQQSENCSASGSESDNTQDSEPCEQGAVRSEKRQRHRLTKKEEADLAQKIKAMYLARHPLNAIAEKLHISANQVTRLLTSGFCEPGNFLHLRVPKYALIKLPSELKELFPNRTIPESWNHVEARLEKYKIILNPYKSE